MCTNFGLVNVYYIEILSVDPLPCVWSSNQVHKNNTSMIHNISYILYVLYHYITSNHCINAILISLKIILYFCGASMVLLEYC